MTRAIIADARKVSAKQFIRHVFGPPIQEVLDAMGDAELDAALKDKNSPIFEHLVGEKFRRLMMPPTEQRDAA